ncbi:MAG: aminopeptidase [bacterium]
MRDERHTKLACLLLDYSVEVKPGENLYLEVKGKETLDLAKRVLEEATLRGIATFWFYSDESLLRQFLKSATEEQMKRLAEIHLEVMKRCQAYIGLRGSDNPFDLADVPDHQKDLFNRLFYQPVHLEQRVKKTRWVVLRYPNNAMAQLAQTSQEAFEDFYFSVCLLNYPKLSQAEERLYQLMTATDQVHILSPGTDLRFSIKGIKCRKCDGHRNIPDGEVFTAPVKDSVEGYITFNTPTLYQGIIFENVKLTFQKGRIVQAEAGAQTEKLNRILDTDEGARYIGEFSLGVNPFILHPMKDTLFDEKIAGSLHFTPGQAYEEADNGNRSAIHWDMVLIQRPEYGGGEIWFDGQLIRKDGTFTDPELESLFSAESLKG